MAQPVKSNSQPAYVTAASQPNNNKNQYSNISQPNAASQSKNSQSASQSA
jgi:hypothetical protein